MDEHTLNDLLECSVCLERLDTSSKVLPCQHTFCRKCLEVIVSSRQELRCPECRVLVEVKIDDLPPNVLLMRILEGMKNAAAVAKFHHQQQQQQHQTSQQHSKTNQDGLHQQQKLNHPQLLQNIQQRQQPYQTNSAAQQQQQLQPQLNTANHNLISTTPQHVLQQRRCLLPHAYALYDFESTEPTDLHFKKGDLVLLKRKVDSNWYVGQLNNGNGVISEGTFPINHVQVVVPLPTPQCIALYDFKMPPNEEQGCLTFKKGTVIHVLRRVDHNWAEGSIGTTIGIFPIAFVELNALAKQVLGSAYFATNTETTLTLTSPPNMPLATTVAASSSTTVAPSPSVQLRNPPPMPMTDTNNSDTTTSSSSPSNSSSNATSPHSVSTSTTTSNALIGGNSLSAASMPSSSNQSLPSSPLHEVTNINIGSGSSSVRFRDKRDKRHSLNALLSSGTLHVGLGAGATLSILQSNRHSAEILSIPNDSRTSLDVECALGSSGSGGHANQDNANSKSTAVPQSTVAREQQQAHSQQIQPNQAQQQQAQQSHQRANVMKTSVVQQHMLPTLPWGYLALYPYKPRKSDELELKKGCVYIVTERCLDGWFKGKNWQDITGVFPGNYVTPLRSRDQQQLMHQWKYVPLQSAQANASASPNTNCMLTQAVASTSTQKIQNLHQPPDLPPRQVSNTSPLSSVWTKPLGHTVEAFFNRYSKTHDIPIKEHSENDKDLSVKQKENKPSGSSSAAPIPPTSSSTTSSAVQLMKRLAHIKPRSKSPNSALARSQQKNSQSQLDHEKPTLDHKTHNSSKSSGGQSVQKNNSHINSTTANHGQLHPVHVRSGSCPSQLLQSLPHEQTSPATTALASTSTMAQIQKISQHSPQQKHQQISPHAVGYGSQQLRGPKERPHLQNARQSMDASTLCGFYNPSVAQQQQLNAANVSNNASALITNHRKSHSLDAGAILSTSNIDYGSISANNSGVAALVAPCNITAAAVAASATTKSAQNSRESRFRCVVPYPPNSEIELELQVGDIIYVQRRQKNGWYKGTHARTNKTGLFPASFVEPDI